MRTKTRIRRGLAGHCYNYSTIVSGHIYKGINAASEKGGARYHASSADKPGTWLMLPLRYHVDSTSELLREPWQSSMPQRRAGGLGDS